VLKGETTAAGSQAERGWSQSAARWPGLGM